MVTLPAMQGLIRRRILVNFRVDPEVMQRLLPAPFRPKLVQDRALAGICLIRLERIRPKGVSLPTGVTSENAAHRVAVWWPDGQGRTREGVYIPRRDTDSLVNHLAGGRFFPGEHHLASFAVEEADDAIHLKMESRDGQARVELRGRVAPALPESSVFASLAEAAAFFEQGALGYSATRSGQDFDGLRLATSVWEMQPLAVDQVFSSYFLDITLFPPGSVEFDCALLMRNIPHEWHPLPRMRSESR